jgi:hypothetical protein
VPERHRVITDAGAALISGMKMITPGVADSLTPHG